MKSDYVQSVIRTFDIIEALQDGPLGLMELSKKVALNKSTVHRLLNTLIYKGYVVQEDLTSKYRLTLRFLELGNTAVKDMDIVTLAKPYLQKLADKTNEVIHLVLIEDMDIVYIDKIETTSTIRMHSYIGKRIPLYSSAVGKAYMAEMSDDQFHSLWLSIEPRLNRFTLNTILSEDAMTAERRQIRDRGYAIDNEENEEGVICVAATIAAKNNTPQYAISISTPKMRLNDDRVQLFGQLVKETAKEISLLVGSW